MINVLKKHRPRITFFIQKIDIIFSLNIPGYMYVNIYQNQLFFPFTPMKFGSSDAFSDIRNNEFSPLYFHVFIYLFI